MSNKTLRNIIRIVHMITGLSMIAFVYNEDLRTVETFVTLLQAVFIPMVILSGVAMWQQATLSRLRRSASKA